MAKYMLFDLDDTLFPSTEFSSLARKNAINAMLEMGLEGDYTHLRNRLQQIIEEKSSNYGKHFDELCAQLKVQDSARYVAAAVAAYHDTKTSIQPFPRVPFTLMKLKEAGYKLYIATNGNSVKQWDKLIRLGIAVYFDGVFVSQDLGTDKSEAFFRKVLAILGAEASECIMVGDREDTDILPAQAVGLATVRILRGRNGDAASRASFTINNVEELLDILQRL